MQYRTFHRLGKVVIFHFPRSQCMNIEKVDSNFLFTVDCENPRWPPLTKNVILANEDVIEKDLPYNMSIFNSYTTSQY